VHEEDHELFDVREIRPRNHGWLCSRHNAGILLVVQEGKSHLQAFPEAQVIADAIAAFQENDITRSTMGRFPLSEEATIYGITMVGSSRFYKVKVAEELSRAIRHGLYPATQTIVRHHIPRIPRPGGEGMLPLDNRKVAVAAVQCFEAFKGCVL